MSQAIDSIVSRCSKFSGWNLQWSVRKGVLYIEDPKDIGKSRLALTRSGPVLYEVYGRMRGWGITSAEQDVIYQFLGKE